MRPAGPASSARFNRPARFSSRPVSPPPRSPISRFRSKPGASPAKACCWPEPLCWCFRSSCFCRITRAAGSPPAFSMLRCRFVFPSGAGARFYETTTPPLPRALLVERCRVLTNQDLILSALTSADFNPREVVILESPPDPYPQPALEKGTVRILDTSTDDLTIEAHLKSPAILLITDRKRT